MFWSTIKQTPISVLDLNPTQLRRTESALCWRSDFTWHPFAGEAAVELRASTVHPVELRSSDGGRAPKLLFTVHRRLLAAPRSRDTPFIQLLSASDDEVSSAPSSRGITPKGKLQARPAPSQLNCDTSSHQHLHTARPACQLHPTLDSKYALRELLSISGANSAESTRIRS